MSMILFRLRVAVRVTAASFSKSKNLRGWGDGWGDRGEWRQSHAHSLALPFSHPPTHLSLSPLSLTHLTDKRWALLTCSRHIPLPPFHSHLTHTHTHTHTHTQETGASYLFPASSDPTSFLFSRSASQSRSRTNRGRAIEARLHTAVSSADVYSMISVQRLEHLMVPRF
jgi:hypothetical protein